MRTCEALNAGPKLAMNETTRIKSLGVLAPDDAAIECSRRRDVADQMRWVFHLP
jgi:hypothetical protein